MNYLQLLFRDRPKCLLVPLSNKESVRMHTSFQGENRELGFEIFTTQYGQLGWVNAARVQMVRFLYDPHNTPKFDESQLLPSEMYREEENSDEELEDIYWRFSVWLTGRTEP